MSVSSSRSASDNPRNGRAGMSPQGMGVPFSVDPNEPFSAPVYEIREPFPDRLQAQAAAEARLSRFARQTRGLKMSV